MTYLKSIKNCLYGISAFCIICFVLFRLCSVLFTQLRLELYGEKTKAVEIAQQLKSMGLSVEDVAKATGLTADEVKKL